MATRKSTSKKSTASKKTQASRSSKVEKVMHEFKHGDLKTRGQRRVTNPKQAIAIALSEAREAGEPIPPPKNNKRSAAAKKATARKTAAKKSPAKKAPAKKTGAKRTAAKKSR